MGTPEQIAEAGQRLARLEQRALCKVGPFTANHYYPNCDNSIEIDVDALRLAQQALREWVPREDREQAVEACMRFQDGKARRLLKLEDTPDA